MARITVLGAGMMGTALTWPLADRGHEVNLVGTHLDEELVLGMAKNRVHAKLGLELPKNVHPFPYAELGTAIAGADIVALGVSSAGVRWAAEMLAPYLAPTTPVLMIAKGLEWDGQDVQVLPDVFAETLPSALRHHLKPVAVAGPCIAGELARRVPTTIVFTGRDAPICTQLAELARGPYYRVFTSDDVRGVETCAALKNAFAMGVGFASGLHEAGGGQPGSIAMHNYEAAVFAEAVVEMQRMVELVGGRPETSIGLPGVGDLNVTCNGGRTGRFGRFLGLGLSLTEAVDRMQGATLECLDVLAVLRKTVAGMEAQGRITAEELPLLRHLIALAQGLTPIMPFDRFFGGER